MPGKGLARVRDYRKSELSALEDWREETRRVAH